MEENQNPQLTPQQFAQKVKAKYPQYKDVDDVTLAKKMVEKYPEYAGQVNFNNVKKKESSEPTAQERPSVSPTKPTQPSTSSATEQPTRAAASVSLGGPTKLFGQQEQPRPQSVMYGDGVKQDNVLIPSKPIEQKQRKYFRVVSDEKKQVKDQISAIEDRGLKLGRNIEEIQNDGTYQFLKKKEAQLEEEFKPAETAIREIKKNNPIWWFKPLERVVSSATDGKYTMAFSEVINLNKDVDEELLDLYDMAPKETRSKWSKGLLNLEEKEELIKNAKINALTKKKDAIDSDVKNFNENIKNNKDIPLQEKKRIFNEIKIKQDALRAQVALDFSDRVLKNNFKESDENIKTDEAILGKYEGFLPDVADAVSSFAEQTGNVAGKFFTGTGSLALMAGEKFNNMLGISKEEDYTPIEATIDWVADSTNLNWLPSSQAEASKIVTKDGELNISTRSVLRTLADTLPFTLKIMSEVKKGRVEGSPQSMFSQLINPSKSKDLGDKLKVLETAYRSTVSDNYQQAKDMGLDNSKAFTYANIMSLAEGVSENIMPDFKYFDSVAGASLKNAFLGNLKEATTKQAIKNVTKDFFKNTVSELGEEEFVLAVEDGLKYSLLMNHKNSEFFNMKRQKELIAATTIMSGALGARYAPAKVTEEKNRMYREIYNNISDLQDSFNAEINSGLHDEKTREGFIKASQFAANVASAIANAPETVTADQVDLLVQKRELEEKKKTLDSAFHPEINEKISAIDSRINDLSKAKEVLEIETPQPEGAKADVRDFDLTLPDNKENIVVADSSNGFILIDSETKAPIEVLNENAGKENVGISKTYATKEEAQTRIEELKAEPEVKAEETKTKVEIPDWHREEYDKTLKQYEESINAAKKYLEEEKAKNFLLRSKSEIKFYEDRIKYYEDKAKLLQENPVEFYKQELNSFKEGHKERLLDKSTYKQDLIDRFGTTDFEVTYSDLIDKFNRTISDYEAVQKTANENAKLKKPTEAPIAVVTEAVETELNTPQSVLTTVTYKGTEYSKNDAGNWVNNKTGNEVKGIGPKGKALIATLNDMVSTESTTQQQPAATEQVAKTEIEEALDDIVRPKTTNVIEQVDRAKKAISKILPGVEIIYHDTEESYSEATGEKTNGLYDPQTKKIHVNGPRANKRTVAHEVAHAVILRGLSTDKEAAMLTKRMFKALKGSLKNDSKRLKELEEFAKSYEKGVRNEEKISELLGYLASEYETLPQPTKNIIQKWLEKIAIMLKMKPFTDKEVVDFMNTLAERVREGQEITEQDVAILIKKIDNNESFENEYTPTNGTVEETSSKRRAQVDDTVIKESDIIDPKTLIGKPLEVVYYDNFTSSPYELRNRVSGSILSKKGEGGPGYSYREEIRKKGIVAAFTNVTKGLNLIQGIRSRNEVAKENAIVGVALQNKETGHLGNKNTELDFYSPTEGVIAQAINDKLITEDQAVKMLKGAVDAYRQTKKGSNPKSSLGFTSNDFSTLDEFYKKINSISFERRGTFNSIVIPSKSNLKITKSTKPYVKTWLDSGIPTLNEYYDATSERYTKEAEPHDIVKYIDPSLGKLGVDSTVNITDAERKRAKLMGVDIVTIDDNLAHTSYPVVLFGRNIGVPSTFNSVRDIAKEWNVPNPFFKAGRRSDKATPVRIPEVKETKKTPNVSGRRQISPENSSNYANMTEDGKGNFVFYHYGPRAIKFIDPKRYGSNKGSITSKPEIAAMGRVGGMSQFYTTTEFSEANVVGDKYMIKVPMDKVYDFNTDPDNLIVKAKEMFKEKHPDLPFTANDQLAYITKLAEKAGYDMTVAEWNNRTRAQSTKPLKPVDVQTMDGNTIVKPFKEDYESNVSKGFTPVIPTSKEAMLKKVYDDINAERNKQNKYDDLYHLAEEFPKKTQEEITDMIEGSNISKELKDAYATALSYEPGMRMSARRQVNTGAIEENTKSEIDRVKKLPLDAEDGATFNLDGTKYDKGGLIVPVTSLEPNTNQKDLSSEMVAKFTKDNESKIGDDSIVKVGIYKFPDKDTVSVDMSIVIPNKYRAVALEFGKMIGQESLYDLDANENVKTGADGMNPVNLTDEQFRVAAAALKEGKMPQITISRRQQTSAIDRAVAAAKSRGFDDKTIMNYLVSRGYTSEEATRSVLKYNKSVAEKIREEEGVFTRAGRRRIVIALDKFRRITVSKRAFNTKTGLQLREFMEGNINAELREARIALEEYDKMLPKDKAQRAVIEAEADKFLKGDTSANLPLEFKAVVGRFRTHIDNLSMRLIDTGTLTQAQADKLRSNIGQYVNRSYQVFDDPKWKDKVTEEMKEAVRNELRNLYYSMKGNVPKSKKDRKTYADKFAYRVERAVAQNDFDEDTILNKMIEDEINNMLEPKKAADFVGQKSVASKDLSIMKQKNPEIPLSVRQLMGEYGNAGQNYAKTVQKLSALMYKADFLNKMRDLGLGVFFFEKDDPNRDQKEFNTRIAADSSKTMNPLNGLWTTPELAEMFKEDTVGDIRYIEKYLGKGIGSGIMYVYRTYLKTLGAVKKMKTAYSVGGHVKNVLGNVELVLSNAYINPKEYANAFMTLKNSNKGEFKKKMDEYTRLGILSSNIDSSEIRKLFNSDSFDSFIEARIKKGYANTISKFDEKVSNLYQTEDDFFKILGYEIEMKRYEKAYPNKSKEEIQRIVSNNIKNILPNYNRIGQIGNFARALPLASTFMSYQLESYRTAWNNIALAKQEIASGNSELKSIGIKRIIAALSTQTAKHFIMHSLGTVVFSPILSMMAASGADDEEDKEGITDYDKKVKYMKLMLPEYAKEDNVVITKEGDGKISFINFSSSDPRKGISNTISAAIQGKDPIDGLTEGLKSIMDPFLNEDILLQAVTNIKRNEKQSGDKIYEEAASDFDKGLAITNEMWKVLQPGTYTSAQKIYKSDDVRNEIVGQFTGYKTHEIDVKKNLYFSIKKLKAMEESAMNVYRDANYQFEEGNIDKSERNRLKSQAKKSAEKTYEEMREYLKAASYFGAKDYEIDEAFEKNGISSYVIKTLWANEMPVID